MPRKIIPKDCGCGCGTITKGGQFVPGHDAKLMSAILQRVGGLVALKELVESVMGEDIALVETGRSRATQNASTTEYVCPECGHQFQGGAWTGIDAHWKSKHEQIMPYELAWELIRKGEYKRKGSRK
jgi:ribosomal protein L37AE/L43A